MDKNYFRLIYKLFLGVCLCFMFYENPDFLIDIYLDIAKAYTYQTVGEAIEELSEIKELRLVTLSGSPLAPKKDIVLTEEQTQMFLEELSLMEVRGLRFFEAFSSENFSGKTITDSEGKLKIGISEDGDTLIINDEVYVPKEDIDATMVFAWFNQFGQQ